MVAAVFNTPVVAVCLENFVGTSLFQPTIGDAVSGFVRGLPGFFVDALRRETEG